MSSIDFNRPPYVQWEMRAIEDRAKSLETGHYVAKDVAFAIIMRPGSKDRLEKEAEVWLSELRDRARKGEIPAEWHPAFLASFKAWRDGEELPSTGTPLKSWPVLSPAQIKMIISEGIFTVEDLAALPDSELPILGIGGLNLREKARSWLAAAEDKGKLAEENAALKLSVASLVQQVKDLAADVARQKLSISESKK